MQLNKEIMCTYTQKMFDRKHAYILIKGYDMETKPAEQMCLANLIPISHHRTGVWCVTLSNYLVWTSIILKVRHSNRFFLFQANNPKKYLHNTAKLRIGEWRQAPYNTVYSVVGQSSSRSSLVTTMIYANLLYRHFLYCEGAGLSTLHQCKPPCNCTLKQRKNLKQTLLTS